MSGLIFLFDKVSFFFEQDISSIVCNSNAKKRGGLKVKVDKSCYFCRGLGARTENEHIINQIYNK